MKLNNIYFILRHGKARSNEQRFLSCWPEKTYNPVTETGRKEIDKIIPILKNEKIDLIFSSDLPRTKQTAEMVAEALKLKTKFDKRLREIQFGILNRKPEDELNKFYKNRKQRFIKRPLGGENYRDIKKRTESFLKAVDKKYKNKKILIVSHGASLFSLQAMVKGLSERQEIIYKKKLKLKTGEVRKLC